MSELQLDGDGVILCQGCGEDCLHHERIEVFEREQDAIHGLHATIEGQSLKTDDNLSGNPSIRRHGLSIFCSCELCDAVTRIDISQHKGKTYIEASLSEVELPRAWMSQLDG